MKKRLSVDLDLWLHDLLAQVAKKRNVKITKWIVRAIIEKMIREKDITQVR